MNIEKNKVVKIAYIVRDDQGILVDQATVDHPLEYLHGHGNLIPGLEHALVGKTASDKFEINIEPQDAYGLPNDNLVQKVPREIFESIDGVDEIQAGMRFIADTEHGPLPVVIAEVTPDFVVVDGNHELAGKALAFEVEVVAVRDASAEEIAHGHVHGPDGHHQHDESEGASCGCGCGHEH